MLLGFGILMHWRSHRMPKIFVSLHRRRWQASWLLRLVASKPAMRCEQNSKTKDSPTRIESAQGREYHADVTASISWGYLNLSQIVEKHRGACL